jgi:hypothetical protein
MLFDDLTTYVQAKTHTGDLAHRGIRRTRERLENPLQSIVGQADALVRDLDLHA